MQIEKSSECHNHKIQPTTDTKRKRKRTKTNTYKTNKQNRFSDIKLLLVTYIYTYICIKSVYYTSKTILKWVKNAQNVFPSKRKFIKYFMIICILLLFFRSYLPCTSINGLRRPEISVGISLKGHNSSLSHTLVLLKLTHSFLPLPLL